MPSPSIEIVRVGDDPFGRGEPTVFYRDHRINEGKDVFYLWVEHWPDDWPVLDETAGGPWLPDFGPDRTVVWRDDAPGHPYPWRFAVIFGGRRYNYTGVPNQCETRRSAAMRASWRLRWHMDGPHDCRYA